MHRICNDDARKLERATCILLPSGWPECGCGATRAEISFGLSGCQSPLGDLQEPCSIRLIACIYTVLYNFNFVNTLIYITSQAFSWVETQLLDMESPSPGKLVHQKIPMLDPHELLNWLWTTQRIVLDDEDIKHMALYSTGFGLWDRALKNFKMRNAYSAAEAFLAAFSAVHVQGSLRHPAWYDAVPISETLLTHVRTFFSF